MTIALKLNDTAYKNVGIIKNPFLICSLGVDIYDENN
jgi:hypothetical protein